MLDLQGIHRPSPETLRRYGLSMEEWEGMITEAQFACACCGKAPSSGRLFIDHEHVRGWKNMEAEDRKQYVRGLACYVCNRFVLNYRVSSTLLRHAAEYLERYAERRGDGVRG